MWQRFSLYDIRVIGHYLGVLVLFSSHRAARAAGHGSSRAAEWTPASHYLLTIGIALIVGIGPAFPAHRARPARPPAGAGRDRFRVDRARVRGKRSRCISSGHFASYLDALFDGVSGHHHHGRQRHPRPRPPFLRRQHVALHDAPAGRLRPYRGGAVVRPVRQALGRESVLVGGPQRARGAQRGADHAVHRARSAWACIILATVHPHRLVCLFIGMEPLRAVLQSFWLAISGFTDRRLRAL